MTRCPRVQRVRDGCDDFIGRLLLSSLLQFSERAGGGWRGVRNMALKMAGPANYLNFRKKEKKKKTSTPSGYL